MYKTPDRHCTIVDGANSLLEEKWPRTSPAMAPPAAARLNSYPHTYLRVTQKILAS